MPFDTSTDTIPSVPHVYAVPLTFTFFPEGDFDPPNTSVNLPSDGALNVIVLSRSIL